MKVGSKFSGLSKEMVLVNIGIIEFGPLALPSASFSMAPTSHPKYVSDDFVHGEDDLGLCLLSLLWRETFQTAVFGCDESPCSGGRGGGIGVQGGGHLGY